MKREKKHIKLVNMAIDDMPASAKDPDPKKKCPDICIKWDFGHSCEEQLDFCYIDFT